MCVSVGVCVCHICGGVSIRIDLQHALFPPSDIEIRFLQRSENGGSETCWESESVFLGNSLIPIWQTNCLVKWEPNGGCVCVWGGEVGWREEGRKRAEREREREREVMKVISKHLKKHFPLSYHLVVVSGTRSTNVFPRSSPPSFSSLTLFRKGGKGNLGLCFSSP